MTSFAYHINLAASFSLSIRNRFNEFVAVSGISVIKDFSLFELKYFSKSEMILSTIVLAIWYGLDASSSFVTKPI